MTTPNQPAPKDLDKLLGIGHFEMGGGGTNYGQNIDEGFVDSVTSLPFANLGNMLSVLAEMLLKLPLEALKAFESLVPGGFGGSGDTGSIVGMILGILDPRKAVQTVEDFLTWVGEVFTPLQGLVGGINDALDRVIDFMQQIVDAIITGVRGIPLFGPALADALGAIGFSGGEDDADVIAVVVEGIKSAVTDFRTNTQSSAEALSSFFNQPRLVPPWVGALSDDVAFDVDKIDGTTAPTLGQVVLIPIKVIQDRVCDAIKFGISATTMTNCYVGLYDCDETTGDLAKVLDLGDCKSQLDTAFNQQTIDIPTPISVQRGEIFYIGVLQVGGTAAALHRSSSSTNFTTGLFPRFRGNVYVTGSQTSLPSSIAVAGVSSGTRFWGALGTAAAPVAPGSVFLSDSFGRPDGSLGAAWSDRAGAFIIVSNQARASSVPAAATFNTRLSSLSQRVGFTHASPITAISRYGVSLRGNGMGAYVALHPERLTSGGNLTATIRTHASYGDAGTSRATYTGPSGEFGAGVVGNWVFECVGDVYSGYRNGTLLLQWTDSGAAFSVGAGNTEVGQVAYSGDSANRIDNWFAQDL